MSIKAEEQKAEWKSLTPAKRRVAIATDALGQVLAGGYTLSSDHGDYLSIEKSEINDDVTVMFRKRNLSSPASDSDVAFLQKNCQMCARGALLLSRVRKFNSCSLADVGFGRSRSEITYISASSDHTTDALKGAFSVTQLEMIEAAFERWGGIHDGRDLAREFGEDHDDDDDRMIAILQNILDHKGTFKPAVRYEIVSY